jgi:hypothetical protein
VASVSTLSAFSLIQGGPVYRLGFRLGLLHRRFGLFKLGLLLGLGLWAPMLVLSVVEGLFLGGVPVPFAASLGTHARFLLAIPLLFAAEALLDPRLRSFVEHVAESRMVTPDQLPRLEAAARSATRLRDWFPAEAVLLAIAATSAAVGFHAELPDTIVSWRVMSAGTGPRLTATGWWYSVVALPVFQFLLWRWGWRILIWWIFLWRLAHLDLQLIPTHPDLIGGLGYLPVAQARFAAFGFATSTALAGVFAENMLFAGLRLEGLRAPALGLVVIHLTLFVGPLLFFTPRLAAARRRGIREYGLLAERYTRGFDAKWIRGEAPPEEPIMGTPDLQSLADLASSYDVVNRMGVVPFGKALPVIIVIGALAPLLPLVLLQLPLDELIGQVFKTLLGV